jgi:hypothetical protein
MSAVESAAPSWVASFFNNGSTGGKAAAGVAVTGGVEVVDEVLDWQAPATSAQNKTQQRRKRGINSSEILLRGGK